MIKCAMRVAMAVALALSVQSAAPTATSASYPGTNGSIVFSSSLFDPEGQYNLLLTDALGSINPTPLTQSPLVDEDATWSPGGTQIAFTRYAVSFTSGEIYVIKPDGSGLRRLTNHAADDYSPSWSPDGSRIVFTSNRDGDYDLYSMSPTGTNVVALTSHSADDFQPAWSPDRTRIAFISARRGTWELYVMPSGGGAAVRLTDTSTGVRFDSSPQWSPDGTTIIFHRHTENVGTGVVDRDIMTINVNGSGLTEIVGTVAIEELPNFSPAGDKIVFDADIDDPDPTDDVLDYELYMADANGTNVQRITTIDQDLAYGADWQPMPAFPLVDARFSPFEEHILWIYGQGITTGCDAERYCPEAIVTRGQMAAFLDRALNLPAASQDYFTDDNGTSFEDSINSVREVGIASGCTASTYCPASPVTRGQMAAFLDRALNLPAASQDYFTDDNGTSFEDSINDMREAGIASGCTPTTYCPTQPVTRGQMAAFLHRALD